MIVREKKEIGKLFYKRIQNKFGEDAFKMYLKFFMS